MNINNIPVKEILDFEKENNLTLIVNERPKHFNLPTYYAFFENSEVLEGRFLCGKYGNGETIDEAILNYAKEIEGKKLIMNAYTGHRKEITCPKLIHTKSTTIVVINE